MQAALKPHLKFEFCPASEAYTPPPPGGQSHGANPVSVLPPPPSLRLRVCFARQARPRPFTKPGKSPLLRSGADAGQNSLCQSSRG